MKKLATLFTDSLSEFSHVTTIVVSAMIGAAAVVLGIFTIPVSESLKIGFSAIANQFVFYLFGPVPGCAYGGMIDILNYLVKPMGAYFPPLTLVSMLTGVLYGAVYYKRPLSLRRILAANLAVSVICNIWLNTVCICMLNGYELYGAKFYAMLPGRIIKNLIMWPINSTLFFLIARRMEHLGIFRSIKTPHYKDVKKKY